MKKLLTAFLLFVAARVSGQTIIADTIDVHNPINCKHFPPQVYYNVTFRGPGYNGCVNVNLPAGFTLNTVKNIVSSYTGVGGPTGMIVTSVKKTTIARMDGVTKSSGWWVTDSRFNKKK